MKTPVSIHGKPVVTFEQQIDSGEPEVWTRCSGIEIPKATWRATRRYLRKFKRDGILFFSHDDGPATIVAQQLMAIAGAVSINWQEISGHEILLWDEKRFPFVDGSKCDNEDD